jgi:predicted NBD/HSP70 family sugar kinase
MATAEQWRLSGQYISLDVNGTADDAARGVVNLVNIQGSGRISLSQIGIYDRVIHRLTELDPSAEWRGWWGHASGARVSVSDKPIERASVPMRPLPKSMRGSGKSLGINVGGRYARLVWLQDGQAAHVERIDLEGVDDVAHVRGSVKALARFICHHDVSKDLQFIGIAWSAPRTALGLRAMSLQMRRVGEAADLLDAGQLDAILTGLCGCPVRSWNDGEAVAAAEANLRPGGSGGALLVFKLGTSFATGLAVGSNVCLLPMQLAKCVLLVRPIREYSHPSVGLKGTARDLIGAESIERTYAELSGVRDASYEDFCQAATREDDVAMNILAGEAAGLAELCETVERIWRPVEVVATGRNVSDSDFRELLYRYFTTALCSRGLRTTLTSPVCDVDLGAAMGAAILTYGTVNELWRDGANGEGRAK